MTCSALNIAETGKNIVGGAILGCINGAITSVYSYVAISTATLAWVGSVGGICGGIVGSGVYLALKHLGVDERPARVALVVSGVVVQMIVTGAILIGTGMAAGSAFTVAASTLILPGIIGVSFLIGCIVAKCILKRISPK